ncbi:MAG: ABC transporter ATP-binding protein [Verrucomicrobia bacterium]|nr:ABC transporter ATP-binding protein [Verrucomicrobiota bacterium]
MTPPVLHLANVGKSYPTPAGPVEVLRAVNLQVHAAEFVVITGPSGSGKTTLLSIAGLLDAPSTGTVAFAGKALPQNDERALRHVRSHHIGMIFQRFHLLEHRSVVENVMFRYRYLPHDRADVRRRALALLDEFGLADTADRPARVLSAGERQRVAIARAVVLPPMLLIADEPTGNLDAASADRVMACFRSLHRQGITVMLVTHNLSLCAYATRHLRCVDRGLAEAA